MQYPLILQHQCISDASVSSGRTFFDPPEVKLKTFFLELCHCIFA